MDSHNTPVQNVPATQVKYAGFGLRFLAYWVDFLILFLLGSAVQQVFGYGPLDIFRANSLGEIEKMRAGLQSPLFLVINYGLAVVYILTFWLAYDGATPGKKLLGIKITRANGEKLTFPVAFIRYLGTLISNITIVFFAIAYLWIIWDKRKQALHDKIAGTIVVRTGKNPQIALGFLITFFTIILFFAYIAGNVFQMYRLGVLDSDTKNTKVSLPVKNGMSSKAKAHYDKTQELFNKLRQDTEPQVTRTNAMELISEAKAATEAQPDNAFLWSNLGDAYTWMVGVPGAGDFALKAYQKAEQLEPTNVVYVNGVGDQLISNGKYEEAVLQLQKSLRLTDKSGYAYFSLGGAYQHLKIYDEARTNYTKALSVFKNENSNGKFDEIILKVQKALASLPK